MTEDAVWRFASASVTGTSHCATGTPCQDYSSCKLMVDASGHRVLSVAVSDGAGSAEESATGAALACSAILEQVELFIGSGGEVPELDDAIVREWIAAVREAIADHASEAGRGMRDYACTLLFAIISETSAAFGQIGDGAIVVGDESGGWCWVFWPQRGEFANTTFFVTADDAVDHLMFEASERRRVDELAIFSDGLEKLVLHYASRTVHAPFFNNIFRPMRRSKEAGADLALSQELERYLGSKPINDRTDDDKTIVLATRLRSNAMVEAPNDSSNDVAG